MDAYMIGRGSRRRHQDRQEHEIFPLHDDDAYFGPELNYDNSFDHLEYEDCSGDDDSQLRTEIVDYTNLEAPKEHRLQGIVSSQRSTRIPAPADAVIFSSKAAASPTLGKGAEELYDCTQSKCIRSARSSWSHAEGE